MIRARKKEEGLAAGLVIPSEPGCAGGDLGFDMRHIVEYKKRAAILSKVEQHPSHYTKHLQKPHRDHLVGSPITAAMELGKTFPSTLRPRWHALRNHSTIDYGVPVI